MTDTVFPLSCTARSHFRCVQFKIAALPDSHLQTDTELVHLADLMQTALLRCELQFCRLYHQSPSCTDKKGMVAALHVINDTGDKVFFKASRGLLFWSHLKSGIPLKVTIERCEISLYIWHIIPWGMWLVAALLHPGIIEWSNPPSPTLQTPSQAWRQWDHFYSL